MKYDVFKIAGVYWDNLLLAITFAPMQDGSAIEELLCSSTWL